VNFYTSYGFTTSKIYLLTRTTGKPHPYIRHFIKIIDKNASPNPTRLRQNRPNGGMNLSSFVHGTHNHKVSKRDLIEKNSAQIFKMANSADISGYFFRNLEGVGFKIKGWAGLREGGSW